MLDLAPHHQALLRGIIRSHAPQAEVWAYGSRVNGRAHRTSDLDLVLRNPVDLNAPSAALAGLHCAIEESTIPILIDLRDWALIPEAFREVIEAQHVVIFPSTASPMPQGEQSFRDAP